MAEQSSVTLSEPSDGVRKSSKVVLEDMSKEDLIKQVKRQLILLQKTKSKCDDYNKRIAELERESVSETSANEKIQLDLQIQEMQSALENECLEKRQLLEQLTTYEEVCSSLKKEKYSLQEQFDCMKLKMDTLSETCQFLQKDCTDLQHQKKDFLDQVAVLMEARDSSLHSLKSLKDQLNASREQTQAVETELSQAEEERKILIGRLKDCCDQLEAATNQNVSMQEDYATMRSRWRDAMDEHEILKLRIEELETIEGKNQSDLQNQLTVVTSELEETKCKCQELQNENREKTDETKELDEEVKRLSCDCDRLKSTLKELDQKAGTENELRNQLVILEKELELASSKCVEFQELWERQNNTTNSLQEGLRALQSDNENRSNVQDKIGDWELEKEEYLKQIEELHLERNQLLLKTEHSCSELNDEKSKWDLEKKELISNLEILNQEKEGCLQKMTQIERTMETQKAELNAENENLVKELENLKLKKESYFRKVERMEGGDGALSLQLTEAMKRVKMLEEDLRKTKDQKQDLVEELVQVRDLQKFLEDEAKELREEYEKMKIEIKTLEADLENDSLHIRHLEKELRQTEEREHESNKTAEALHRHLGCVEEALRATEQHLDRRSETLNQEMEAELEAAKRELLQLKEEAEENADDYEKHKVENRELKEHISELSSVIQNRTDEMKTEEWEKEKSYLEEQLILQRETNEQLNLEMTDLKESLLSLRNNMEKLLQVAPQMDEENERVIEEPELHLREDMNACAGGVSPIVKREPCDEIDELLKRNAGLRDDLTRAVERSVDLQEEVDTKCQMMEQMLIEMNNLVSQIDHLNAIIIEKEQDLESVVAKLEMQTENVKHLELALKEKDDFNNVLKSDGGVSESSLENVDERAELRTQVEVVSERLAEKEVLMEELLRKNDSLLLEVESVNYQKHHLQEQVNGLRKELEESGSMKAEELCGKLAEKETGVEELMQKNDSLMLEVESVNYQKHQLQEQVNVLRKELEQSEANCLEISQQLEDSLRSVQMGQDENSHLNDEVDRMKTVIQNMEEELKITQIVPLNPKEEASTSEEGMKGAQEKQLELQLKITEEKMAKFKALAVKVKKELIETKKEIAQLKQERNNFVHQIEELSASSRQTLLNFQSLQGEYDNLQDEYEVLKKTSEKNVQSVTAMEAETAGLKEEVSRLNSENSRLQLAVESTAVEKKALEQARHEADSRVIILKSEKEAEQRKVETAKSEAAKLNQKIKSLEEQLSAEKEHHRATAQKLEHKLKEAKQQSVLDLEIADYEHSIFELNEQISSKETEIAALQEELSRQAERIASLMEQIGSLEGQHDVEEERVKSLKSVLAKAKEEAAEMREINREQQEQISAAKFELETITALKEDIQVQLAESAAEISSLRDSLRNIKESQARTSKSYESRLAALEEELGSSKHELELNRREFESYKVRVHNVLRQKQQPAVVNVVEQEHRQRLEKSVEQLRMKLQQLSDELHTKNVEIETLQQEHDHLSERQAKVVEDLRRKDEIWMSKVEQLRMEHQHQQISWDSHKKELQHQIALVEANYKQRASDQEALRKIEMAELHSKLAEKEKELNRCHQKELVVPPPSRFSPNDETPFDILTQERQEGEGSECTDTLAPYKPVSLVTIPTSGFTPLEQLLQSSADPENFEAIPQDFESLSSNLNAAYKKLDHLTELLNESEASNMRMSEQVRILKEEIRRMERNKEREELSSNLEYLKNIVLKFLVLQGGSERQRLLPVLTTVLRLSPEEQTQLQAMTIGESSEPSASDGWGNYLHRWSGLM